MTQPAKLGAWEDPRRSPTWTRRPGDPGRRRRKPEYEVAAVPRGRVVHAGEGGPSARGRRSRPARGARSARGALRCGHGSAVLVLPEPGMPAYGHPAGRSDGRRGSRTYVDLRRVQRDVAAKSVRQGAVSGAETAKVVGGRSLTGRQA